jgi:pilus assembly protein CpaF
LQAMNTGHDGSLTTIHSNSPRDTLSRIETMTLMAGMDLPIRAVREQMASALDVIVHLSRLRDGTRRITSVSEVLGMEGDTIVMQDIYQFDFGMGVDDEGRFLGRLKSTGIRPNFSERLSDHGIHLETELFTLEPFARRVVGLR